MFKLICLYSLSLFAQSFVPYIGPYLQMPNSNEIIVSLETRYKNIELYWGDIKKGKIKVQNSSGESFKKSEMLGLYLHKISITDFPSNTEIHYWIKAGKKRSKIYKHKTLNQSLENFSLILMSDAQHGHKVTQKQIRESVMKYIANKKDFPVRMTLFAGDLVQEGDQYHRWKKEFFGPLSPLNEKILLYPALGNHEKDHRYYYKYFDLPKNGSEKFLEHWYFVDYQNVRIITLDTNEGYRIQEQLSWLEGVLNETQKNKKIDFVFAQFHHPFESELWVPGNTKFSGLIQKRLEKFSNTSGIPSFTIFGHTHGYSRGHSFNSNHTMLNVASIGGAIDDWGDYKQKDYPEYVMSLDNFGWVLAEIENGENPLVRIKRYSYGNDSSQQDEGIVDQFEIKKYNKRPSPPTIAKVMGIKRDDKFELLEIQSSSFFDEDNDTHQASHIQVSSHPHFDKKVNNFYQNNVNIFFNEDLNQNKSLVAPIIKVPVSNNPTYIRLRYRDSSLGWSSFSKSFKL